MGLLRRFAPRNDSLSSYVRRRRTLTAMLIGIETTAASLESGGDTTYIRELLSGLARIDTTHRYRLIAIRPHPFYRQLPERFTFHRLSLPWSLLRFFTSLPLELRRHPVDVLHVQYILPVGVQFPSVVTIHDLHFEHYPQHYPPLDRWFLETFVRRSAQRADRIITVSDYSKRDIAARYGLPPEKVVVIPNGIRPMFKPESDPARLKQVRDKYGIVKPYLFSVGRTVDPRKNIRMLIDAYASLPPALSDAHQLIIAGKKAGRQVQALEAETLARLREGRVIFTDFVAEEDMPALMAGATALVWPSIFEGFGLPVLEAMACGTPVITSNVTSLPEVAGEAALMINPYNKDELTAALQQVLIDADLRQRLRELGLRRAASYSWDNSARQTLAVYEALHRTSPASSL
jgi:glycosyltransferase involved in cell wall biosynthesis